MIQITIHTDNDSFQDETVTHNFRKRNEVARILKDLAITLERGEGVVGKWNDSNGNAAADIQLTVPDIDLS